MKIFWTVITDQQKRKLKAEKLADILASRIELGQVDGVEAYPKFENAWKIQLEQELEENEFQLALEKALRSAWSVAQPWTLQYVGERELELIFNRQKDSIFRSQSYNVIRWMHLILTE